ncbi:hypothetical protein CTI12_AA325850 [Artemisia annua]|uniref:GAG-pre-integrase domain-containing protein n=1 Tax=Artemisia annua TaxID=35608 RepID=A0A2U1MZE1_ARTAN|nr:hypothetical protein CTI12_AA325850 [Artemisia annua]
MALGAKLKLVFIDGSCPKPAITDGNLQRWIRCDYMVTCWILNSMVTELSEAFIYAQYAYELWKEIAERYGQGNRPLIYQLERELSKITQVSFLSMNKTAFSNVASNKSSLDVHTFHARLGQNYVSKLVHLSETKNFDVSEFHCESCLLSKQQKLPFPICQKPKSLMYQIFIMGYGCHKSHLQAFLWRTRFVKHMSTGGYKTKDGVHHNFGIDEEKKAAFFVSLKKMKHKNVPRPLFSNTIISGSLEKAIGHGQGEKIGCTHEKYNFKIAPDHKASWVIDQQPLVKNACGTPLLVFKLADIVILLRKPLKLLI